MQVQKQIQTGEQALLLNVVVLLSLNVKYAVKCCSSLSKSGGLIQLYHATCSQMSNLMNQARLKVLKARDDLIAVSISVVKTQRFYSYHLLGNVPNHSLKKNMTCD